MDDLNIHIDELVVEGTEPPDGAAVLAGLRAHTGSVMDARYVSAAADAITESAVRAWRAREGRG